MPTFIDLAFVGQVAIATTACLQILKSIKGIPGSKIPPLSGPVGAVIALLWMFAIGDAHHNGTFDWANIYKAVMCGIIAATVATASYEVQKNIPLPNLLPTATELRKAAMDEMIEKKELVEDATKEGVDVDTAKEVLGVAEDEPPPTEETDKPV